MRISSVLSGYFSWAIFISIQQSHNDYKPGVFIRFSFLYIYTYTYIYIVHVDGRYILILSTPYSHVLSQSGSSQFRSRIVFPKKRRKKNKTRTHLPHLFFHISHRIVPLSKNNKDPFNGDFFLNHAIVKKVYTDKETRTIRYFPFIPFLSLSSFIVKKEYIFFLLTGIIYHRLL